MAQQWTEDDWLKNALTPIANSVSGGPLRGLQAANIQSEIEKRDFERRRMEEELRRANKSGAAFENVQRGRVNPYQPTPAELQVGDPLPLSPDQQRNLDQWERQREDEIARYRIAILKGQSMGDIETGGRVAT